ncbi:MAG: acyl-CoA thioesterase [Acidimicrobiales bacterium]
MARLLEVLDVEEIDQDIFRGFSPPEAVERVFGGQVAAQALTAASRTVTDKAVHSLHAYFLRLGDPSRPIIYEVDRIRDGRSYATRRVVGVQGGRAIFNLQASFHVGEEDGYYHQVPAPEGRPDPEGLPTFWRWFDPQAAGAGGPLGNERRTFHSSIAPIDVRVELPVTGTFERSVWFRAVGRLSDDPVLHSCVAAYASDLTLLNISLQPHGFPRVRPGFIASLDHAMWFHRPFRADEWLLYQQESPSAGFGRGFTQGHIFTAGGDLAISVVQEGAIRPPRQ